MFTIGTVSFIDSLFDWKSVKRQSQNEVVSIACGLIAYEYQITERKNAALHCIDVRALGGRASKISQAVQQPYLTSCSCASVAGNRSGDSQSPYAGMDSSR